MRISNFREYVITGKSALDQTHSALVDVTTGFLWWKKTQTEEISRFCGEGWFFTASGVYTPGYQVEELVRSYTAKRRAEEGK